MDEDLICHQCLNEAYLIRLIRRTGVTAECSFCLKRRKAIPFENLVSMVDDALQKIGTNTEDRQAENSKLRSSPSKVAP